MALTPMAPGMPPMMAMYPNGAMPMQMAAQQMPMMMPGEGTPMQLPPVMAQVISSSTAAPTVEIDEIAYNEGRRPSVQMEQPIPLQATPLQARAAAGSSRFAVAGGAHPSMMIMPGQPVIAAEMVPAAYAQQAPSYAPAPMVYTQGAMTPSPYMVEGQTRSYVPPPQMQPQLSYAPGPQMVRVPSFVAPPQGASYVAQPPPGPQPVEGTLTKGMPDPSAIDQQRNAYAKALDLELQKSIQAIQEKKAMEKKMLAQAAQQQKQMYELQVDQMVQGQAAQLDEHRNMQLLGLQQEAMNQKIGLENQAAGLKMEYQQRAAQEEMMFKQYELQRTHYDAEQKLLGERQQQAAAQVQVPPPGAMFLPPGSPPGMMMMQQQPPPGMRMQMPMEAQQQMMMQSMSQLPPQPMMVYQEQAASYGAPPGGSYMMPQTYQAGGMPMTAFAT